MVVSPAFRTSTSSKSDLGPVEEEEEEEGSCLPERGPPEGGGGRRMGGGGGFKQETRTDFIQRPACCIEKMVKICP